MATQYWVDDFFVDLSRNQVTHNGQSQTLAPKALAVLTHLARNQGKVVSQDQLLSEVWRNRIVSPNTLQRCIAQLRKALGDDGKVQVFIKTHAKQGYSLECDVRWHEEVEVAKPASNQPSSVPQPKGDRGRTVDSGSGRLRTGLVVIAVVVLVILASGYRYLTAEHSSPLLVTEVRALTATDDKEFDATYSPDGQHFVFHRYLDKFCVNKLWAKDVSTQRESQLTTDWGAYGSHSFSKDGNRLAFMATKACSEPLTQTSCYDLVALDFNEALESPQQPQVLLQCKNSEIRKPIWIGNNAIALMQRHAQRWKLISYSLSEGSSTDLHVMSEGNLVDFTYSQKDELFAVISIHVDGQHYIEMLRPDGRMLSRHQIEYPQGVSRFNKFFPSFDPLNRQLVFSTGKQLFTLSYEGEVARIDMPLADNMARPAFHPNGKKLLMIRGPYDSDIVRLSLSEAAGLSRSETTSTYASFERSNLAEDSAVFQPGGELVAFLSDRSGGTQLWVSGGNGPQQLTNFEVDTYVRGIKWAADGNSLLVNANDVLTQVFLDATQRTFPTQSPVAVLFHWDSQNNVALILTRIAGMLRLAEVDLSTRQIKQLSDKIILWALRSEDGELIYKDHTDRFWRPGPVEDQPIHALDRQGGESKSFVIDGNSIYAINDDNQLWSYDLNTDTFEVIAEFGPEVDNLSDITRDQLLMTVQVSAKKEVVELTLAD